MSIRILRSLIVAALLSASLAQAAVKVGNVEFARSRPCSSARSSSTAPACAPGSASKVYAMGLYLRAPLAEAGAILADKGRSASHRADPRPRGEAVRRCPADRAREEPRRRRAGRAQACHRRPAGRARHRSARSRPAPRSCSIDASATTPPGCWSIRPTGRGHRRRRFLSRALRIWLGERPADSGCAGAAQVSAVTHEPRP